MRRLIDANVALRYLLHDDGTMFAVAEKSIREGACLLPEVLAEIVYVLYGVYEVEREEIAAKLCDFVDEVLTEYPDVLKSALETFGKTKLDFVDCILAAYHRRLGDEVLTFDRKLKKLLSAQ